MAAARGGFTSVVCMANTDPVNDNKSVTEYIMEKARSEGVVRVFPCGADHQGPEGRGPLRDGGDARRRASVAISDDGRSVKNSRLFLKAMEYARLFGLAVICHCEDETLSGGVVHEGHASLLSGLDAVPSIAEEIIVRRDIAIAATSARPFTSPISRPRGRSGSSGRKRARYASGDVRHMPPLFHPYRRGHPHLRHEHAKVNPPLRSPAAMWRPSRRAEGRHHRHHRHRPRAPRPVSKDVEFDIASSGHLGAGDRPRPLPGARAGRRPRPDGPPLRK